ncbi:YfhO family protein [Candidatus Soleaferrea massiliensis]|uniref:YfhO family protein n=1 Tax=Candidatus Soleaferrea massiliensis TaxID=1470354 RepID=UPI0018CC9061|nr:YfhO family protein [Candidatus Soleaferrea massiliensis]
MNKISLPHDKKLYSYKFAFFVALAVAFIIFLPFIIYDHGYFMFFGDFNVQQIPFNKLANEAVHSGNVFWSWNTDLGANFIGSYSFYLLFSPFFWLTLPFPSDIVPFLMAPLLMLKFATASLTAYAYIRRFVKNPGYAVIGGLLYAFSSYTVYNVFFNHFLDVLAFFPLVLLALEEFIQYNRRGLFALMICLSAMINYFFFVGECVFLVIYYFIRLLSDDWVITIKKFLWLVFEAVIGVALAAFVLIPSALTVLGNPRLDSSLLGWDFLLYNNNQRIPAILESMFFPPDLPSRPNFFPDMGAKWSSMAAWLPMFGMVGVLSFIKQKKGHWIKRILIVCFVMALIPGLNSIFIAMNGSYYARWFYMPVLIMALATVKSLEDHTVDLKAGFKITAIISAIFILVIGFMPYSNDDGSGIGLEKYPLRFWIYAAIVVLSLALVYLLIKKYRQDRAKLIQRSIILICVISIIYSWVYIGTGKQHSNDNQWFIENCIEGADKISLPQDEGFYRVDVYDGIENQAMFWGMPTIQTFHSVVPASIMEFYPTVGVDRDVSSKPSPSLYGLRSLLSVKYLFVPDSKPAGTSITGFEYYDEQGAFTVYKNEYFLPMGFTYDACISRQDYENVNEIDRHKMLLHAMVLDDDQIEKYRGTIKQLQSSQFPILSEDNYYEDVKDRQKYTCSSFETDNNGFTAAIDLDKDNLVFFSVPYEEGWSATVNGEPVDIEKVNIGFMAVKVPAGENNTIRFNYKTPGLDAGLLISGLSLVILLAYMIVFHRINKKNRELVPACAGQSGQMEFDDILEDTDVLRVQNDQFGLPQPAELENKAEPESGDEVPAEQEPEIPRPDREKPQQPENPS